MGQVLRPIDIGTGLGFHQPQPGLACLRAGLHEHFVTTPANSLEQRGSRTSEPDQHVAAIECGNHHTLPTPLQDLGDRAQPFRIQPRRIRTQQHRGETGSALGFESVTHALPEVTGTLDAQRTAMDIAALLKEGVIGVRCTPEFNGPQVRGPCNRECPMHQPPVKLRSPLFAQRRDQPRLDFARHGRLGENQDSHRYRRASAAGSVPTQ